MNCTGQFFLQGLVNQTLAGQAAQAVKNFSLDRDREMAFAALPGARMAGMLVRLILDLQPCRHESGPQLIFNRRCHGHCMVSLLETVLNLITCVENY